MKKTVKWPLIILFVCTLIIQIAPFSVHSEQAVFTLTQEEQDYLETIKEKPITIAITNEMMYFSNENNDSFGVISPFIELLKSWGLEVEIISPGWTAAFNMLDSKEVDLLGLAVTNAKRREMYLHTEVLFSSNVAVYTRENDRLGNLTNLSSKKIGAITNSALPAMVQQYVKPNTILKYYDTIDDVFSAIDSGEVDCMFISPNVQGEMLRYPNVSYETSLENVIASQAVFSNNPEMEGLMNIINRYCNTEDLGNELIAKIEKSRHESAIEITRMTFANEIDILRSEHDAIEIFDSMVMYPLSYIEEDVHKGYLTDIYNTFEKLTGVPIVTKQSSLFEDGFITAVEDIRLGTLCGAAAIYYNSHYEAEEDFTFSNYLMLDQLSFFALGNENRPLSELKIGTTLFAVDYMDWSTITKNEPIVFGNRNSLYVALENGDIDAIFVGEMIVDYYYTIQGNRTLQKIGNLSVPVGVSLLMSSKHDSFKKLFNASSKLLAVLDPTIQQNWKSLRSEDKFSFMRISDEMSQKQNIQSIVLVVIVFVLLILLITILILVLRFRTIQQQRAAELEKNANTDYLTGLLNRRALNHYLENKRDTEKQSAILLMDVDNFKSINDQFGHDAGDEVLIKVAQAILEKLPSDCAVARWGGEEFLVFMDSNSLEDAYKTAETIRQHISSLVIENPTGKCFISVSIGMTLLRNDENFDKAVTRADNAMYAAKNKGKNCVESL